jgi:hypothetical protein
LYKKIGLIMLVMLLIGCGRNAGSVTEPRNTNSSRHDSSEAEYAIYSALLDEMYVHEAAPVVVMNRTSMEPSLSGDSFRASQYVAQNLPQGAAPDALEDLRNRNQQPSDLNGRFVTRVKYVLISEGEKDELARTKDFWNAFADKYRGQALITFSRVGFSRDMKTAIVYAGESCGWKCGHGDFVLLVRENNAWEIKQKVNVWVS